MFANMVMSKKLTRHARVVFVIACISLPQLGFTATNICQGISNYTWPSNSTCPNDNRICGLCIGGNGSMCGELFSRFLYHYYYYRQQSHVAEAASVTAKLMMSVFQVSYLCNVSPLAQDNYLATMPQTSTITCTASQNTGCKITINFSYSNNTYNITSATTTGCTEDDVSMHPYFYKDCKVKIDLDGADCSIFTQTIPQVTTPKVIVNNTIYTLNQHGFATWNHTTATWDVSKCGWWSNYDGGYTTTSILDYPENNCRYNNAYAYAAATLSTASNYDKIWFGRNHDQSLYAVRYETPSQPVVCCENRYDNCYNNFDTYYTWSPGTFGLPSWSGVFYDCQICNQRPMNCPTGFTGVFGDGSNPQCVVDTTTEYTDQTGKFNLSPASYPEGTTGYINNSACY